MLGYTILRDKMLAKSLALILLINKKKLNLHPLHSEKYLILSDYCKLNPINRLLWKHPTFPYRLTKRNICSLTIVVVGYGIVFAIKNNLISRLVVINSSNSFLSLSVLNP